jgi:hypothetical protein
MKDSRINLRNRNLAAVLAFLIPGAGHFYQGRTMKAAIYFAGILSLFFIGMTLGSWQPVYSQVVFRSSGGSVQMAPAEARVGANYSIGYAAQFFTGLPALPALLQQYRFESDSGVIRPMQEPLSSQFQGVLQQGDHFIPVTGQLELAPAQLGLAEGRFIGTTKSGTEIDINVTGAVTLAREVFGSPRREIEINGLRDVIVEGHRPSYMQGYVQRPFVNWFQAPRDDAELDRLHGRLSQNFDIAYVFTWIAGLLNLMAIWDAYDGPAYGYGDEEAEDESDDEADPKAADDPSASADSAPSEGRTVPQDETPASATN